MNKKLTPFHTFHKTFIFAVICEISLGLYMNQQAINILNKNNIHFPNGVIIKTNNKIATKLTGLLIYHWDQDLEI